MMRFIIIHSSNFKYFLSFNKMLYKRTKQDLLYCHCHCEIKQEKEKNPIKQLNTDVQVKPLFFMI